MTLIEFSPAARLVDDDFCYDRERIEILSPRGVVWGMNKLSMMVRSGQ